MKKFTTLVLALVLTLSTLLSVVPFGVFAEETAVTFTDNSGYTTGGNNGSIFRKKSDGSVMLSPFNTPLRALIDAGATYSEFTIKMTFTLLSGDNGTEVHTFDTVSAPVKGSNGKYFDIFLNGTGGSCGFCPTANEYYNVYVEIYRGDTMVIYGTYTNQWVYPAIADAGVYYTPTEVPAPEEPDVPVEPDEPEIPEVTYPITIVDTTTYRGFRKNSSGNILFCPTLTSTLDIDGTTTAVVAVKNNAANYTATLDIYYQVGGKDSTELVQVANLERVKINSSSNGGYLDIELLKSGLDYGFCPVAGAYYTVELNILDANGNEIFCDGLYQNVSTYNVETSDYYYASDVTFEGYQTGDASIRFVGGVSEMALNVYDKIDLAITFTANGETVRSFSNATSKVYKTLLGTDANGDKFNAVTVTGSGVDADVTVDTYCLFGYGITSIADGTYSVSITPVAYIGDTAIEGKTATYATVTVADGIVTIA